MEKNHLLPDDPLFVENIICEVKSQGLFDKFRKDCINDVDTKPAYQNLRQRVENTVATFLNQQTWTPELNRNQLREQLRKNIIGASYLDTGVERIVDQVVNPKIATIFHPKVEEIVYKYLGIEKTTPTATSTTTANTSSDNLQVEVHFLPTDLEAVSPDSDKKSVDDSFENYEEKGDVDDAMNESEDKIEEFESPPFERLECLDKEIKEEPKSEQEMNMEILKEVIKLRDNSNDSNLSKISGLTSQDSVESSKDSEEVKVEKTEDTNAEMPLVPTPPAPPTPPDEPQPPKEEPEEPQPPPEPQENNNDSQLSQVSSNSRLSVITNSEEAAEINSAMPAAPCLDIAEEAQMPKFNENSNSLDVLNNSDKMANEKNDVDQKEIKNFDLNKEEYEFTGTERPSFTAADLVEMESNNCKSQVSPIESNDIQIKIEDKIDSKDASPIKTEEVAPDTEAIDVKDIKEEADIKPDIKAPISPKEEDTAKLENENIEMKNGETEKVAEPTIAVAKDESKEVVENIVQKEIKSEELKIKDKADIKVEDKAAPTSASTTPKDKEKSRNSSSTSSSKHRDSDKKKSSSSSSSSRHHSTSSSSKDNDRSSSKKHSSSRTSKDGDRSGSSKTDDRRDSKHRSSYDKDKDRQKRTDRDKERDRDKDKDKDKDKDRSKDKDRGREKDREKERDRERDRSDRDRSDRDKEKNRDRDKDRDKYKSHSHSSSKYKKDKDSSSNATTTTTSPSGSGNNADKKKDEKIIDDHSSSREKQNRKRRSTDRDSNDGGGSQPESNAKQSKTENIVVSNTSTVDTKQKTDSGNTNNNNTSPMSAKHDSAAIKSPKSITFEDEYPKMNNQTLPETSPDNFITLATPPIVVDQMLSGGDSINIEQLLNHKANLTNAIMKSDSHPANNKTLETIEEVLEMARTAKVKRPKIASNIVEARKLMKVRKKIERDEKKRFERAMVMLKNCINNNNGGALNVNNDQGFELEFACDNADNKSGPIISSPFKSVQLIKQSPLIAVNSSPMEVDDREEVDLLYFPEESAMYKSNVDFVKYYDDFFKECQAMFPEAALKYPVNGKIQIKTFKLNQIDLDAEKLKSSSIANDIVGLNKINCIPANLPNQMPISQLIMESMVQMGPRVSFNSHYTGLAKLNASAQASPNSERKGRIRKPNNRYSSGDFHTTADEIDNVLQEKNMDNMPAANMIMEVDNHKAENEIADENETMKSVETVNVCPKAPLPLANTNVKKNCGILVKPRRIGLPKPKAKTATADASPIVNNNVEPQLNADESNKSEAVNQIPNNNNNVKVTQNQRYSSDDLYKPRTIINSRSRRSRIANE